MVTKELRSRALHHLPVCIWLVNFEACFYVVSSIQIRFSVFCMSIMSGLGLKTLLILGCLWSGNDTVRCAVFGFVVKKSFVSIFYPL